jgi:hypothetical protein
MAALKPGASPVEVADEFYAALVAGDMERFKATVKAQYRQQMERARGASPEFWWESGRRYVEEYGVRWEYDHTAEEEADHVKLFYKRIQADGSQRGSPLPIHLVVDDDGEWRVDVASV